MFRSHPQTNQGAARPAGDVGRGRVCARARVRLRERGRLRPCNEATLPRLRARAARAARRARALANVNVFVSRHRFAFSPPTILEQQAQEQRVLEVLDSLRRLLDSPQRILSHVRLDSTHGTSRTAMPADERKRRRAAAEKARHVRLRQQAAVSAAETAATQNEPLADEQQRVLATPAPHTPPITSSLLSALCCATATRAAAATGMVVCVWQEVGISAAGPGGGFYATPRLQSATAMALFFF